MTSLVFNVTVNRRKFYELLKYSFEDKSLRTERVEPLEIVKYSTYVSLFVKSGRRREFTTDFLSIEEIAQSIVSMHEPTNETFIYSYPCFGLSEYLPNPVLKINNGNIIELERTNISSIFEDNTSLSSREISELEKVLKIQL